MSLSKPVAQFFVPVPIKQCKKLSTYSLLTYTQDLEDRPLTKEQAVLVGKGYAGPPVSLNGVPLTEAQVSVNSDSYGWTIFLHTWVADKTRALH